MSQDLGSLGNNSPREIASDEPRVGVVIPTLNAGPDWRATLDAIKAQSWKLHRVLIVDSTSTDDTVILARSYKFDVMQISPAEFNHGATRQWAAEYLNDCRIVIFMTQDAILSGPDSIKNIVACFSDSCVAVAYGRQIPRIGAKAIEAHSRYFNYGSKTIKKDLRTVATLGAKVYFCSNSFAAYDRAILLKLGGFNRRLILGEDMEFAARAIDAGYANVYCANASVLHSHDYTIIETFRRYFDIGVFDVEHSWMRHRFGSHSGEGKRFVSSELRYLWSNEPRAIPLGVTQILAKVIGYRIGRLQRLCPVWLKRKMSMTRSYWN